jgi:glutamate synthase (NADPH/NADH) small chain
MGKPTGFLEQERHDREYEPVKERLKHWHEFVKPLTEDELRRQGARCMDCGIPFCHNGCPVNNQIPDWNDLVYHSDWQKAYVNLHSTNNFPEMTGRICPAPCEESCTLNLNTFVRPVTIKSIECAIADKGRENGWLVPQLPEEKTGKTVAVVGSGPAGMACAQQLARAGHEVTLYEKNDRAGGLLRYGIPDFKMEKHLIDERVAQMEAEGVTFIYNAHVGKDVSAKGLAVEFDAVVLSGGAENPRNLNVPGRELNGVHFAMEFLPQQNKRNAGDTIPDEVAILAGGKHVVVVGGGDTGSDCIGTSTRQGAAHVKQLEIVPPSPVAEDKPVVWPDWPRKERISSSQQEVEATYGEKVQYTAETAWLEGDENGNVKKLHGHMVEWGAQGPKKVDGTEFTMDAELVLLAMGFVGPREDDVLADLDVKTVVQRDVLGRIPEAPEDYKVAGANNVFAAGDMRRGQSLVVWAIREGRQCANAVDTYLMGTSVLPR